MKEAISPSNIPLPAYRQENDVKGRDHLLFNKGFDETHHPELVEGEGLACLPDRQGKIL